MDPFILNVLAQLLAKHAFEIELYLVWMEEASDFIILAWIIFLYRGLVQEFKSECERKK